MSKFSLFYIILFLALVIFSYLFVDPNLKYLEFILSNYYQENRQAVTLIYLFLLVGLFIAYFYILKSNIKIKQFKILITLILIIGIFSYPAMLSYDIFNYLTTAKVLFFYQENPYLIMPIEFSGEPFLDFTRATNKTALYGPVWIALSGIPFMLGLGKFIAVIFGLKVLVFAFFTGILYFIFKITGDIKSVMFFALNPLVLIETAISGHNDVVMIFFALSAFYLLSKNKLFLPIFLLIISILVKFATVLLVPVFVYVIYKKIINKPVNYQRVYLYSAISMAVIFLLSPIREEMYPWYAIWFLPFVALTENKILKIFTIFLSFGLMLRYLPYMYLGSYEGITPYVREILFILPIVVFILLLIFWRKKLIKATDMIDI
jgi:hypothetical protein